MASTFRLFMERVLRADPRRLSQDLLSEWVQELAIEVGVALVPSEDERLTILFPGPPRAGDRVRLGPDAPGAVVVGKSEAARRWKRQVRVDLRTDRGESIHTEFDVDSRRRR